MQIRCENWNQQQKRIVSNAEGKNRSAILFIDGLEHCVELDNRDIKDLLTRIRENNSLQGTCKRSEAAVC